MKFNLNELISMLWLIWLVIFICFIGVNIYLWFLWP